MNSTCWHTPSIFFKLPCGCEAILLARDLKGFEITADPMDAIDTRALSQLRQEESENILVYNLAGIFHVIRSNISFHNLNLGQMT